MLFGVNKNKIWRKLVALLDFQLGFAYEEHLMAWTTSMYGIDNKNRKLLFCFNDYALSQVRVLHTQMKFWSDKQIKSRTLK